MPQSLTPALEYSIQSLPDDGFYNGDSWDSDGTTKEYTLDQHRPLHAPDLPQFAYGKVLTRTASARYAVPPEDRLPPRKLIKTADWPPRLVNPEEEKETRDSEIVVVSANPGYHQLSCRFYVSSPDKYRDCLQPHNLHSIEDVISHLRHTQRGRPFYGRGLFTCASALLPWTTVKSNATFTMANICYRAQCTPSPQTGQRDPLRQTKSAASKEREKGNRKRRRVSSGNDKNNNSSDRDDEGSSDERGQSNDDATNDNTRLWSCLYYASDPHTHFRCLGKYSIKRFPDVVQHLQRCHLLQESFYCPKCWQQQTSIADRDSHVRDCNSPNLPRPGRLYDHELAEVKKRLKGLRGYTDEDKWFVMWDMMFPGHPRPVTPYVEHGMAEPARVLRRNNEPALQVEILRLLGELGVQPGHQATTTFAAAVAAVAFQVSPHEPQYIDSSLIGNQAAPTGPATNHQSGYVAPSIPAAPSNEPRSRSAGDQFEYGNQYDNLSLPWYGIFPQ